MTLLLEDKNRQVFLGEEKRVEKGVYHRESVCYEPDRCEKDGSDASLTMRVGPSKSVYRGRLQTTTSKHIMPRRSRVSTGGLAISVKASGVKRRTITYVVIAEPLRLNLAQRA